MKIHRDQYPEQVRARERAQYRAPREQHLQAQRRRSERERLRRCVTDSDLALFRADPLLEQKRGLFEVIVYRVCGLQTQKLPQHLIAEHRDDLATNEQLRPEDLTLEYRRRYGHNKRAPLCCAELCQRLARITKARNARCRYQGMDNRPEGSVCAHATEERERSFEKLESNAAIPGE